MPYPSTRTRFWPLAPLSQSTGTESQVEARRRRGLAHRVDTEELLDLPNHDPAELAANLRDIRTVNRLAGGVATVLCHLPGLLDHIPHDRPANILDLATGSGDIPRVLATWADRRGRLLQLTVTDRSPEI